MNKAEIRYLDRGRMSKRRGKIFVLSSPSGGGKTTVCAYLKRERFNVKYSVSATTRSPRSNEKNGRDYIFISRDKFRHLKAKNKFLEWTDNFGDLYGTPRDFVEEAISKGRDVILAIDVKGAMRIKKTRKDAVSIFLLPPSFELLKKRLKGRRTEDGRTMARRLKVAKRELGYSKRYDYAIVNNNINKAVEALRSIIIAERNRVRR